MPTDSPSFKNLPNRKKHVCEFCGRDDFTSRQALSYHRLKVCEKRPKEDAQNDPGAAAGQDPPEASGRKLSDSMAASPPKPPAGAPALKPPELKPPDPAENSPDDPDELEDQEEEHWKMNPTLFFFLILLLGLLALIILFWDFIEREGRKLLKRFDPPCHGGN